MNAVQTLTMEECEAAQGGLAPLLAAAYSVVTSKTFLAFATTITLIGTAADIGTEVLE